MPGVAYLGATEAYTPESFERQLATNAIGPFRMARAFLPSLRKNRKGHIIFFSSVAGRLVIPFGGPYTASKWAIEGLAESFSYELCPFGIEVAIVEPGSYATNIFKANVGPDDLERLAGYNEIVSTIKTVHDGLESSAGDASEVSRAIAALVAMPVGTRPNVSETNSCSSDRDSVRVFHSGGLRSCRRTQARNRLSLVHGAWADGSSWDSVVRRLLYCGYTVDVPPNNLRGVAIDSAAIADFLGTIPGPIVLVGHSYGGTVITNAALGNAAVKALVYIDTYLPAQNETVGGETGAMPGSILAPALVNPASVFALRPFPSSKPGVVDSYVLPGLFVSGFAAGLPRDRDLAATLETMQRPLATSAIGEPSGPPAWKTIRSWDLIGTADDVIPPAEQALWLRALTRSS